MPTSRLERIKEKIRLRQYDMSAHAMDEMAEDDLDIEDVEWAVRKVKTMYGYSCEYCEGTVQPKIVARKVFKHKKGFVILENITIGVCDSCGNRYHSAEILHTVHQIATGKQQPERTEKIPVGHMTVSGLATAL